MALLKFLIFEEKVMHFHFVLGSAHYVADPAYLSVFSTVDKLFEVRGYISWSSSMHIA